MGLRIWNGVVLGAAAALWLASGTQREKPVIASTESAALRGLEGAAAADPGDAAKIGALAQAYLDARAPGQAISVVATSSAAVRATPSVEHVFARALLDEGRAADALAVEKRVVNSCAPALGSSDVRCDSWLLASAMRRVDILQEMVGLGIEDANAQPEASLVAYHNATREVRLAVR